MFLGEYQPNLTKGNRLALPAKIRAVIPGSEILLAKGFEACILGYPKATWEEMAKAELTKPVSEREARQIRRQLFSGAILLEIDPQGRIVVPSSLLTYAGVKQNLILIGAGDHFEIWEESKWRAYLKQIQKDEKVS